MRTEEPLKEQSLETVAYRMNQLERTVHEHHHSNLGSGSKPGEIVEGFLKSPDYVSGSSGWIIGADANVEFNEGTFRGSLEAGSIHIPDEDTTANSFHTDTDGNSWWGCTQSDFTSNNDNANAYILKDGTAKFQNATVSGYFNISSNDLDDVSDGTTYGKVKSTQISAGEIVLSAVSGNLDDVGDGSTYGKVKLTQISAGEIILSAVSGDLDDISDGSTYAKSTANQNTGGSRAYSGIDASGDFSGAVNPSNNAPASGAGLYLGADYMGYYDGSGWKTYMDSSGNFYLDGSGTDELSWNGSTLTIRGSLNADDISAGTLTSRTIQTSSSGQRVEMAAGGHPSYPDKLVFHDINGNYTGEIWAGASKLIASLTPTFDSYPFSFQGPFGHIALEIYETEVLSETFKPTTSGNDLGGSSNKWQNLYLSGNITVGGNVDGVNVSSHAANASAHHVKYSDSDARSAVTGTALPGSLLSGNSSYDLGSSTYPWNDVYADSFYDNNGSVVFDTTSANVEFYKHIIPTSDNNYHLGDTDHEWTEVWAYDTSINHTDLAESEIVHPDFRYNDNELAEAIASLDATDRKKNIAQRFKRLSHIPKGSVVAITNSGCVPTTKERQTNLLGVVSIKPGLKMGSKDEGIWIAKIGKVPCRVIGKCQAGDLLESAPDGCAQRADNPRVGAIIGRAKQDKDYVKLGMLEIEIQMA